MHNCQWRSVAVSIVLIFILSSCSSAESEGVFVHAVESAQAVIVHNVPQHKDDHAIERPCSDPSTEDACLIQEAVEALSPIDPPEFSCGEAEGRIEQRVYPGFLSGESIPDIIYLPPCYDPYLQVYPVLYLLHGKPQDEFHWLQLGVDEIVDKGILECAWAPFIIVMPQQPEPLFTQTDGGRGSLEQELIQGLIPFILDRYAITGAGEGWTIAGISRGGVWALEIGFQHPDQFHNIPALCPALNVNSARLAYNPMRMLTEATLAPEMIFLGVGERDSARSLTLALAEIVDDLGLRYQYLEVPGNHESATWIKLLPDMLSSLTHNW